jgi:hypothetical protein
MHGFSGILKGVADPHLGAANPRPTEFPTGPHLKLASENGFPDPPVVNSSASPLLLKAGIRNISDTGRRIYPDLVGFLQESGIRPSADRAMAQWGFATGLKCEEATGVGPSGPRNEPPQRALKTS